MLHSQMALVRVMLKHCVVNVATGNNRKPKRNRKKVHRITLQVLAPLFQMLSLYEYVKYKEFGKVSMGGGRSGYICNTTNGIKTEKTSDSCRKLLHVSSSTAGMHVASMRITDTGNVTVVEYQRVIDLLFIILASLSF